MAVFQILAKGQKEVGNRRKMKVNQWKSMAKACKEADDKILEQACPKLKKVIGEKRRLPFKKILHDVGFPREAAHLASQMLVAGTPVVREFPITGVFPDREHKATKTPKEILQAAKWSRRQLAGSMRASASPAVD